MRPLVSELLLKRFGEPDEVQDLGLGRFEVVRLGAMAVGRAICLPSWRWSEHVGSKLGRERCDIEHLGLVIAGAGATGFGDGRITVMRAGDFFYVPPTPHDWWVVGDESSWHCTLWAPTAMRISASSSVVAGSQV